MKLVTKRLICTFRCTFPMRFAPFGAFCAIRKWWIYKDLRLRGQS